jgi:hypothetical protein
MGTTPMSHTLDEKSPPKGMPRRSGDAAMTLEMRGGRPKSRMTMVRQMLRRAPKCDISHGH